MEVTELPIVSEVKPLQLQNASWSMVETAFGMVMDVSPVHPKKAHHLMVVTEFGIVMEFSPIQLRKASIPMDKTVLGMIVFLQPDMSSLVAVLIIALQLLRLSYTVLPLSTTMDARLEAGKGLRPIYETELPMLRAVSPLQPVNARSPMVVTEFGIERVPVSPVQLLKA